MGVSSAAERNETTTSELASEHLGGARGDFVANLGKRRTEIRAALETLRSEPTSKRARDELRRRLHALGAGAKLLGFTRLAGEVRTVEERLAKSAEAGVVEPADVAAIDALAGQLAALAWGQIHAQEAARVGALRKPEPDTLAAASAADRPKMRALAPSVGLEPIRVLVVGPEGLAQSLELPASRSGDSAAFEVERSANVIVAEDVARALAPEVLVLDGDEPGALGVIDRIAADPLTAAIPLVVCLKAAGTPEASKLALRGVAKILAKPVAPSELRRACALAASSEPRKPAPREPLGALDLDALGKRLAAELANGLAGAVEPGAAGAKVELGEGTEVLAAIWGAVARIRDVVTIRSEGRVRFEGGGPEGALPLVAWSDGDGGSRDKRTGQNRGVQGDHGLAGARVVVADDDAAVVWFLAGVLKAAGATVFEARDGERALELAKHCDPDLVISDVLMPGLDGFALCRALKRDVALRDVPTILLSWKEDLLQRMRELGADADAYLRKEASAGVVVQRARELTARRTRIARRIEAQVEARGRLDGLTTHALLRIVATARPDATVRVIDALHLYEIELRGGRPVRATRTGADGRLERGRGVLGALLAVGDGRFVVTTPREEAELGPVPWDISEPLTEVFAPALASARAAQALLTGDAMLRAARIELDAGLVRSTFADGPERTRKVAEALIDGASPRSLVTSGAAPAWLLEDVLGDLAARGAVLRVLDGRGGDALAARVETELATLRGVRSPVGSIEVPGLDVREPAMLVDCPEPDAIVRAALGLDAGPARAAIAAPIGDASPELDEVDPWNDVGERELDAALFEASPGEPSPAPPSGARVATPAPHADVAPTTTNARTPSPRPIAETRATEEPAPRELTPTPSRLPPPPGLQPMLSLGSLHPPPVFDTPNTPRPPKNVRKSPQPSAVAAAGSRRGPKHAQPHEPEPTPRYPLPSAYLPPQQPPTAKRDPRTLYWVLCAMLGVGFAVWARWSRERATPSETALLAAADANTTPTASPGNDPSISAEKAGEKGASKASTGGATNPSDEAVKADERSKLDDAPEDLPLRESDEVKKGQGMLEIVAGKSDTILLDGKMIGSGPVLAVAIRARKEPYEITVRSRTEEKTRSIVLKEGRLTRLRLAPPWQR